MFELQAVTRRFGALVAVDDLSFTVGTGELFGVAGPNGAGKSTLMNLCTGALRPSAGEIRFQGRSLAGVTPQRMARLGIARTFQIPQVFQSLSVRENVEAGALFGAAGKPKPDPAMGCEAILDAVGLTPVADQRAATVDLLSRKKVMLGAALATRPKILFMDEPLAGLNQDEVEGFADLIADLRRRFDLTVVMVEHKIRALARLSDRMLILHHGSLLCLDTPPNTLADPQVIDVYLGAEYFA